MSLSIKIAITPKASGQSSYEILDLIVVNGRAYLSLKDENTSAVTDTTAWTQITENTYDIAVRLGYVGTETEWLASLSAASEAAAVIANNAASAANTAAGLANTATTNANNAASAANTAAANITSTVPWSLYRSRVLSDSGVISDIEKLTKLYIENLKLLPNTVYMWDGSAGIKTRTSGANTYATKLYDMSAGNRDAVQATEANQPFVGGGVAPNEKRRLKANSYVAPIKKSISHTNITIAAGQPFTVVYVLKLNKASLQIIDSMLVTLQLRLGVGSAVLATNSVLPTNKTVILEFRSDGVGGVIKINNVSVPIATFNPAIALTQTILFQDNSSGYQFDGELYYKQILNKCISEQESQSLYSYLRLHHPEIEGINIGNQHWATSNYEGVVTGNGTIIPEVQGASTAANLELVTNGGFDVDPAGYWSGQLITWQNDGSNYWLRSTYNGSGFVGIYKTLLTAGKPHLVKFKARSSNITSAAGSIGDSATVGTAIKNPNLSTAWQDYEFYIVPTQTTFRIYFYTTLTGGLVDIDDISLKEVGWADLTTPAWCYYNNDPLNGAVYGKLYNWYAVQAIAANPPSGWRVPTQADYVQLSNHLGGNSVAGGKLKKDGLFPYYNTENVGATNESGFSGIGCGYRMTDGIFTAIRYGLFLHTNSTYTATLARDTTALNIMAVSEANKKLGHAIRLIRNEPVGAIERNIETGYITNALGATNLDIAIPFGYQVESVRIDSETNITGLSAKLLTGALVELETLFTAKSVTANVQKVIVADADQSIQQTDAVVRINGTKANTTSRFRVWVKITKVVFS